MSRLIKRLRQVSESVAPSIGFKTSTTSHARLMSLIAALPISDTNQIANIADAGIDAILMHSQDLEGDLQNIQQITDSIGDTPWGIWPESMTDEGIKKLLDKGGDFITFTASEAPAALLGEEIGKVIKLSLPLDDGLIRTIDQMQIDAVLLDFREEDANITVSHLMDCQRLTGSIRKPLLIAIKQKLNDKEIRALWEAGVNGLVVEAEEEPQEELARLNKAIASLPQTRKKSGSRSALLPRLNEEADSEPPDEV